MQAAVCFAADIEIGPGDHETMQSEPPEEERGPAQRRIDVSELQRFAPGAVPERESGNPQPGPEPIPIRGEALDADRQTDLAARDLFDFGAPARQLGQNQPAQPEQAQAGDKIEADPERKSDPDPARGETFRSDPEKQRAKGGRQEHGGRAESWTRRGYNRRRTVGIAGTGARWQRISYPITRARTVEVE